MKGVSKDNIDFVISSIQSGTKRAIIVENLMADYLGMNELQANAMLDDFYKAYGGEFKHLNRNGLWAPRRPL